MILSKIWPVLIFLRLCYNQRAYMLQNNTNEVKFIRKFISLILCAVLLLGVLITPAKAATMSSAAGAVTTGGGNLYVRSKASTGGTVLASLKKGSYVTLLSKAGSWWYVEYAGGKYGYCYADYITPVEGTPVVVDTGGNVLNVRSGPGTSYPRIDRLPNSQIVLVRANANGWSKILYNGTKLGFVSSQYLRRSDNTGSNAVSLSVPSYKQTDTRWAGYPLGNRGGTIGTIGCAVTGIAMLESYRTGTTIYPNKMASRLSFTNSGAVYWPGDYTAVTSYSLEGIYKLLKQGKPVLIGGKTSSGGQHWVVITGFAGDSLTASNFTINDPGSNSRTNLQQFFNSFPIFYKYFHY